VRRLKSRENPWDGSPLSASLSKCIAVSYAWSHQGDASAQIKKQRDKIKYTKINQSNNTEILNILFTKTGTHIRTMNQPAFTRFPYAKNQCYRHDITPEVHVATPVLCSWQVFIHFLTFTFNNPSTRQLQKQDRIQF
jgi:hypothetical protein